MCAKTEMSFCGLDFEARGWYYKCDDCATD
jgi:hypothetical protein